MAKNEISSKIDNQEVVAGIDDTKPAKGKTEAENNNTSQNATVNIDSDMDSPNRQTVV